MLDKWVSFAGTIVYWIGAKIAGWLWKVLNSAMIDCFKLGKGMQRLHRSFSSKLLNKPINRSYEILRKGNGTLGNDYIYILKKPLNKIWADANRSDVDTAIHTSWGIVPHLKGMCRRVSRTLHVGCHWTCVSMYRNVRRRNASAMCSMIQSGSYWTAPKQGTKTQYVLKIKKYLDVSGSPRGFKHQQWPTTTVDSSVNSIRRDSPWHRKDHNSCITLTDARCIIFHDGRDPSEFIRRRHTSEISM